MHCACLHATLLGVEELTSHHITLSLSLQYGAKDGKLGDSVYKRLEAALIAFATVFALLQAWNLFTSNRVGLCAQRRVGAAQVALQYYLPCCRHKPYCLATGHSTKCMSV